ncbi:hypothetical protein [uncultured Cellulomonas sp.]|uniref:hypothetical protein n=1 Tax=uncultured Cellulomonas sp. TaxID=189682 RepID=UPI00260182A6|nr:hypothetical protein [uncultured Cellulomonas sp.]
MSMMEPFIPHPDHDDETIAAADPGAGAPDAAPGFGVGGEESDVRPGGEATPVSDAAAGPDGDVPFRTPDPDDVGATAAGTSTGT